MTYEKYTDPIEQAAWEVFVQIAGNAVTSSQGQAAAWAFDAAHTFDYELNERCKSKQ